MKISNLQICLIGIVWAIAGFIVDAFTWFRYSGWDITLLKNTFCLPVTLAGLILSRADFPPAINIFYNSAFYLWWVVYIILTLVIAEALMGITLLVLTRKYPKYVWVVVGVLWVCFIAATYLISY